MILHRSREDYLEAIHVLRNKNGRVRNMDIAEYLGYSKPSVTQAITVLCNGGYVVMDDNKDISLTELGNEIAEKIYAKHEFFRDYLISIGVTEKTASKDACLIEHAISDESFEKIKENFGKSKKKKS